MDFGSVGSYLLKMGIRNQNELVITRELVFGDGGRLSFAKQGYPQVKQAFDTIHGRDTVAVTLRQNEATK
jgi:hypothetical protein